MPTNDGLPDCCAQIKELADFIMFEVPGEPSRSEGAVECAIRLIRESRPTIPRADPELQYPLPP